MPRFKQKEGKQFRHTKSSRIGSYLMVVLLEQLTLHNATLVLDDGSEIQPLRYSDKGKYRFCIGDMQYSATTETNKRLHKTTSKLWRP